MCEVCEVGSCVRGEREARGAWVDARTVQKEPGLMPQPHAPASCPGLMPRPGLMPPEHGCIPAVHQTTHALPWLIYCGPLEVISCFKLIVSTILPLLLIISLLPNSRTLDGYTLYQNWSANIYLIPDRSNNN